MGDRKATYAELEQQIYELKQEIDKYKMVDELLINSEEKYRKMILSSPDLILIQDSGGIVTFIGPQVEKVIGHKAEKFIGNKFPDFIYEKDKNKCLETFHCALSGQTIIDFEYQFYAEDGTLNWLSHSVNPIFLNNKLVSVQSNIRNITQQKNAESEIIKAKEIAEESEMRFKNMFERHNAVMLLIEPESGSIIDANNAAVQFYGYEKPVLCSRNIDEINLLTTEQIKNERKAALEQKRNYFEFPHKLANGEIRIVEVHSSPIDYHGNKLLFSIIHDITDRKKAEQTSHKLQTAIESSKTSIIITDKNGDIEFANPYFSQLTGYSSADFVGKNPRILQSGYHNQEFYKELWNTINSGKTWEGEFCNIKKNGEIYWENAIISPIFDSANKITHFVAIKTDITESKRIYNELILSKEKLEENEKLLKKQNEEFLSLNEELQQTNNELTFAFGKAEESEKKFKDLLDNTNFHLWAFDGVNYTYCNKNWYDYTGQNIDTPLTIDLWGSRVHPEDIEKSGAIWKKNWESKTEHDNYFRLKRHDGVYRNFYCHVVPVYDNKGNFKQFQGFNLDITEQVEAERKLSVQIQEYAYLNKKFKLQNEDFQKAISRAEESDHLKTAFLQNMSHEIRTPMNAIVGFAGMLNKPTLTEEKRKSFAAIIINNTNQLLNIVTDILTISSVETKQEKTKIEKVCINNILIDLLSVFKPQAFNQNISLFAKQQMPDKQSEIYTDKTKITQIFSNLISNSLKFTSQGFVEFGYTLVETQNIASNDKETQNIASLQQIKFYVKDTGIGIPSDQTEFIFERFRQADFSISQKYGGTGLGLSICKGFMELLGGKIWVESELGKGSTFYFTLPYNPVYPIENTGSSSQSKKATTILIAEDEEYNYLFVEELLNNKDYILLHAKDGKEAVEICQINENIDLVLMDIKMPIMDGYTASKQIREFRPNLPIVAQTAYALEKEKQQYNEAFNDYITKPINEEELKLKVSKYIGL